MNFSPARGEGLPRTIIIAGTLLAVAIFFGLVPEWAAGMAATALLFGSLIASDDAVRDAFRWRQTERHRREPVFANKPPPLPLAEAAE